MSDYPAGTVHERGEFTRFLSTSVDSSVHGRGQKGSGTVHTLRSKAEVRSLRLKERPSNTSTTRVGLHESNPGKWTDGGRETPATREVLSGRNGRTKEGHARRIERPPDPSNAGNHSGAAPLPLIAQSPRSWLMSRADESVPGPTWQLLDEGHRAG
jgi:hypothetical protein